MTMRRHSNSEHAPGFYFDGLRLIVAVEGGAAYSLDLSPDEALRLAHGMIEAVAVARAVPEADRQATAPPTYDA